MKTNLLRAAVVACLPFCAMAATFATTPAMAADKSDKSDEPKMSRAVNKLIIDANKAAEAKDYKTVIDKCLEAQKLPDLTDADRYYIERFLGVAYLSLNERDKAREAFIAVVKNPATPLSFRKSVTYVPMSLAQEVNDYATMIELGKIAIADKTDNPDVYGMLAAAYYQTNDLNDAVTSAKQAIDMSTAQGKIPNYATYQVLAFSYEKLKDRPNEVKALGWMVRDYGKPDDWRFLLQFTVEMLPGTNKQAREIAALDVYRLGLVVSANWGSQEFLEAEDAAHSIRSWGDARQVLEMGIDKGIVDRAKVTPLLNTVLASAKKDEPILATVEKSAKGKDLMNVGEAYYGYGRYADAIRVAQGIIAGGGPFVAEAKLLQAMSQIKQGDEAGATQTLANFQGDPAFVSAADAWNIYLTRRYGKTAPAAAAAPAAH
jgi:tetratricopeptide (TPR) repeat protein